MIKKVIAQAPDRVVVADIPLPFTQAPDAYRMLMEKPQENVAVLLQWD